VTISSLAVRCAGLVLAALALGGSAAAESLVSVDLVPEGRLLRIDLAATGILQDYSLSRQGPPEARDLVLRLAHCDNGLSAPVQVGDYVLPVRIEAQESDGEPALAVVFGGVGDSLVSVSQQGRRMTLLIIPPKKSSEQADAYRIGSNDMLQIDVFGHEDLNKTLKVSPSGLVNFPLIGNVHAEGKTVDEVAAEITERLGENYIQDPHVTVSVWEYLSQWVNVIGDVALPGRYYMTGPMTLIDALSQAGGLTENAGREILVTRRPEEVDPASAGEVFTIDVRKLFSTEGSRLNMRLRSGDIVNVLPAEPNPQGR